MSKQVLVTAALTYANGPAHLGHVLEAIQTDVYVRARKMLGDDVIWMWAADTHGTPIMLRARREGITPEELVARSHAEHLADYRDFGLGFDIYYTTHSPEDRAHCEAIFGALKQRGHTDVRAVEQLYSEQDEMFLPDRFVKGTCPNCKSEDQYGDNCEVCGATYSPTDLLDPYSAVSGDKPVLRDSPHVFIKLESYADYVREWARPRAEGGGSDLRPEVRNFITSFLEKGLRDWDISRDKPYFGWEIPGHPGKYFYVWFDAPIGYIGATEKWCRDNGRDFDSYWKNEGGDTEIVHVIGKDIQYFHCVFWPAMLHGAGYTPPSRVQVHGWLMVNGTKMSKSRGTFILARTYLDHLSPDYLRYYLAAKLGADQNDLDLNMEDFANRVNADLVNKLANLASRSIKFIVGRLGGRLGAPAEDAAPLLERARERFAEAPALYAEFESGKALRVAMEIADDLNVYMTEAAPWKLTKSDPERARAVNAAAVYASKLIAAILKPVIPSWAEKMERMLKLEAPMTFANAADPIPPETVLGAYETLAERVQTKTLDAIIEAGRQQAAAESAEDPAATSHDYEVEALSDEVGIEAFGPVDLRVGSVLECTGVKGARKLLQLTVDLGPLGKRTIFSGIAKSYPDPAALVGKRVAVFANLKPRTMKFGVSEGMILAAGASDDAVTVVELDPRARPGERIT
ncbi:MAG: methionine--tRNA ligase [Myxococcales bacterium]|nr:methionine--tRNA ligase [Myxococcales bacterium]MCB9749373.1 methionine--tRNA ligase [Myxococcales bacterium]